MTVLVAPRHQTEFGLQVRLSSFPTFAPNAKAGRPPNAMAVQLHVLSLPSDNRARAERPSWRSLPRKRVAELLNENVHAVVTGWLQAVENNAEVNAISLPLVDWKDHLPDLLAELIERLQTHPEETAEQQMRAAASHGRARREQGYSIPMVVEETRELERVIFAMLQANLLSIDVSFLIPDMVRISDSLQEQLRESLRAYLNNHTGVRKSRIRKVS